MAVKQKYLKLIKWGLDLVMGIVFALLFNARVMGGIAFHEFAGLALGGAILCHLVLNGTWIVKVSKMIFKKELNQRTRINYLLNGLLLLDFLIILISGINISKVALPLNLHLPYLGKGIHISASYLALGLIGIHLGLHWKWVMTITQRIIKSNIASKYTRPLSKGLAILILIMGIYQMNQTRFVEKTVQGFSLEQGLSDHPQMGTKPNKFSEGKSNTTRGEFGEKKIRKGDSNENPLEVVLTFGSMIGAFTVSTYYLDQLIQKRRRQ